MNDSLLQFDRSCHVIYRVSHAKSWIIPGTEDLRPYISRNEKCKSAPSAVLRLSLTKAIDGEGSMC